MIESVIDGLNIRAVRMKTPARRLFIYEELRKHQKVFTAERTYSYLLRYDPEDRMLARLESEFLVDDHNYWYREKDRKSGPCSRTGGKKSAIKPRPRWRPLEKRPERMPAICLKR